jgi:hypothetical protein
MYALFIRAPVCWTWKRMGKLPDVALPLFVALAESDTGCVATADAGDTVPAVRSASPAQEKSEPYVGALYPYWLLL